MKFILLVFLLFTGHYLVAQLPKLVLPVGHMFQVKDAFFTKNNQYIITYSDNVKLWDAITGKLLKTIENNHKEPQEVDFISDKGLILIAYSDSIYIRDIFNDKVLKTFEGNNFSISHDGNTISVMQFNDDNPSKNRNARLYDLKTFKLLNDFDILIVHHSRESNLYIGVDIGKTITI